MGRRRKTTEDLDRKGAFDKNPKRGAERAAEPVPKGPLGDAPAAFLRKDLPSAIALLAIWYELLDNAKEVQLTSADRIHFEMTCRLIYRCRMPGASIGEFAQQNKYLGQLGLNPADRSRVKGLGRQTAEEEEEEWNDFAGGGASVRLQ